MCEGNEFKQTKINWDVRKKFKLNSIIITSPIQKKINTKNKFKIPLRHKKIIFFF